MLYIIHPDYTWFLLYSCLLATFLVQGFFSRFVLQDSFIIISLITSVVINIPSDIIADSLEYRLSYINEAIIFITSFSLITRYLAKKLILHAVGLTLYFSSLSLAHFSNDIIHWEKIVPLISIISIYTLYITYHAMPYGAIVKNGVYFITLLIFILHNIIQYEHPSIFYTILYIIFANIFSYRAFLYKDYQSKVFYTFFSFFILTVAHVFLTIDVVNTVQYLLLYSVVSYFLYITIFPHNNNKLHIIFLFHAIFALLHICYTTLNPAYFLLNVIHSQTVLNPSLHYTSTFCYFTIFICAIQLIFRIFRKVYIKNKINWVHFTYATIALCVLFEAQFVHKKLSSTSDISYFGVIFAIFVHIFYLIITYFILMSSRFLWKKFYVKKENKIIKKLITVNPFRQKRNIILYLTKLKYFTKLQESFNKKILFIGFEMKENMNVIQNNFFLLIPIFLCFFMVIAIFY